MRPPSKINPPIIAISGADGSLVSKPSDLAICIKPDGARPTIKRTIDTNISATVAFDDVDVCAIAI